MIGPLWALAFWLLGALLAIWFWIFRHIVNWALASIFVAFAIR